MANVNTLHSIEVVNSTLYLSFEALFRISRIFYSSNKTVGINDGIASNNFISIFLFLTVLIVVVKVVFHIKTKLVVGVVLYKERNKHNIVTTQTS